VEEQFNEDSLALGCGVNAFVSLSDNNKANTDCFMDQFLSIYYPQLNKIKDEILSEWILCRLTILDGDEDQKRTWSIINIHQLYHLTHCWYPYMCFFGHFDLIPHQ
jgi:hypothetical protein